MTPLLNLYTRYLGDNFLASRLYYTVVMRDFYQSMDFFSYCIVSQIRELDLKMPDDAVRKMEHVSIITAMNSEQHT